MGNDTKHPSVGTLAEIWALEAGSVGDIMSPEVMWQCRVRAVDLAGPAALQRTVITIPAAGFVTGRLVVTIPRPGTTAVAVTVDAAVADSNEDLVLAAAVAIDALVGTTLAGVVTDADADAEELGLDCVAGLGITAVFTPAQQTSVTWDGTIVDGPRSVRIERYSPAPGYDVTIDNDRVAGSPANNNALAAAFETTAEALIATDLAGALVSADDTANANLLIFEPGFYPTVTASCTSNTTVTFGTATDGDYVARIDHANLPGGSRTVTVTRSGVETVTDLADDFEGQLETHPLLAPFFESADNIAGVNTVLVYDGVTGLDITAISAPAPGTLVVSDPTVVVADATPAGPTITVTHTLSVDLNALQPNDAFPAYVLRGENPILRVVEAFPAGATATLDDGGTVDTDVLDGVAVDATGWYGDTGTTLGDDAKTESGWAPRLTLALDDATPATGELRVQVIFSPLPE